MSFPIYYTDGALATSTKIGGYSFIELSNNRITRIYSNKSYNTTNNRMELMAVLCVLCISPSKLTIYTDSMYVIGCASLGWSRKTNTDLWKLYARLSKNKQITFKHVKGHSLNQYNSLCDRLAVQQSNS